MATPLTPSTNCFILAIAGGTASGKTTLSNLVHQALPEGESGIISLDYYYRCNGHLPMEERVKVNYDHPDIFEIDLLFNHLKTLKKGAAVELPIYSFVTHSRAPETVRFEPRPVVIVEGILSLHFPELREMYDFTVFVDAPEDLRLERRLTRDIKERGRTEELVYKQWKETVTPMHKQFCEPSRVYANFISDGRNITLDSAKEVIENISLK